MRGDDIDIIGDYVYLVFGLERARREFSRWFRTCCLLTCVFLLVCALGVVPYIFAVPLGTFFFGIASGFLYADWIVFEETKYVQTKPK